MKRVRNIPQKQGLRPFRIAAVCLFALLLYLSIRIPAMSAQAEKVKKELIEHGEALFSEQAKYHRLKKEVDEINTPDFVERTARRELGYVWYGETIYTIANLAEITGTDEHYDYVYNGTDENGTEETEGEILADQSEMTNTGSEAEETEK